MSQLLRTTMLTSISTGVTFICGFIVAKVVAVQIGPSGVAMVGQFQNSTTIFIMLGSAAVNMGVVKYLSDNDGNISKQQGVISNAFLLAFICSLLLTLVLISFSSFFSKTAFHSTDYWQVYFLFGVSLFFLTANTIFSAIFNGLREIRMLTISNIFFSIVGIIFTVVFARLFGVIGVLTAVNATAVVVFFFNLYQFRSLRSFRIWPIKEKANYVVIKSLLGFSLMSGVSTLVLPASQFFVRNKIIGDFSATEAGYWQGVTKISDYYLSFITTVLSVYYLPRLSAIRDRAELRSEITKGYMLIVPAVLISAGCIWLFRGELILLLYSPEFRPMESLFTFQLLGDFIKICSWLLGFLMWARAMTVTYILTECMFGVLFVFLSVFFINQFGVVGATYAFALNYMIYFIVIFLLMKKHLI